MFFSELGCRPCRVFWIAAGDMQLSIVFIQSGVYMSIMLLDCGVQKADMLHVLVQTQINSIEYY